MPKAYSGLLFFSSLVLIPLQTFGWGLTAHKIVTSSGAQIAEHSSWRANKNNLQDLSVVPDVYWKRPSTKAGERPNHWFEYDGYSKKVTEMRKISKSYDVLVKKYGNDKVLENGTALWRVAQFYQLAVEAFDRNDNSRGIELAGIMSHYIGDLSQPLHVTTNYDGQDTKQEGLHKHFEATIIEGNNPKEIQAKVIEEAKKVLPVLIARYQGLPIIEIAFDEGLRSQAFTKILLANDKAEGRDVLKNKKQLQLAISRMADGAATYAVVLAHLAVDAKLTKFAEQEINRIPVWIEPDFNGKGFLGTEVDYGF